jgi:hypothetical protein
MQPACGTQLPLQGSAVDFAVSKRNLTTLTNHMLSGDSTRHRQKI